MSACCCLETGEPRHQPQRGEGQRRRHAHDRRGLHAHGGGRLAQLVQCLRNFAVVAVAGFGQHQRARAPLEELDAELLLELLDLAADRRLREEEFRGCRSKRQQAGGGLESAQQVERESAGRAAYAFPSLMHLHPGNSFVAGRRRSDSVPRHHTQERDT